MINVRDIGRDFIPREERFMQQGVAQMPISGQSGPISPISGTTPSIPVGIPTQQPFAPVAGQTQPPGGMPPPGGPTVAAPWQVYEPGTPEYEEAMAAARAGGGGQPIGGGGITGTAGGLQQGLPPGMSMEQVQGSMGMGAGGAPAAGAGGFPYPEQWQTATDIYGRLAEGMPGMTEEYAQQAWLPYQRQGQEQAMQAREQAGLGGMRWSTPLAGQLESVWGGASERFGSEMERMRMQDIAGQRGAMLGAAGGLGQLGGQYAQLPLTVSESMMRQGMTQQQMQQMEYDRERDEWLRQQPEYSPLLQYQAGGAQMPTGPSMYGPSFGGQMFDIAGTLGMYGGGGGGRVPTSPRGGGAYPGEWGQFR